MQRISGRNAALVSGTLSLLLAGSFAHAQNLLLNGDLDNPGLHENDAIVAWTLTENPPVPNPPSSEPNPATFASFANHTPGAPVLPSPAVRVGLWNRSFAGLFFGNLMEPVDSQLTQVVPGIPGQPYTFSGWSRWEANYSGGFTTLPAGPLAGTTSPTGTFMEMRFLDGGGTGISSVLLDLRTEQSNDNVWRQHSLFGVAPAGTASVLVTAYANDMVPVTGAQSAFFDDFSLVVPEPGSLALISVAGLALAARRRSA